MTTSRRFDDVPRAIARLQRGLRDLRGVVNARLPGTLREYTPDLQATTTDPTRDQSGNRSGAFIVVAGVATVWVRIVAGSSGTQGDGVLFVDLPVAADGSWAAIVSSSAAGSPTSIGYGHTRDDDSPGNNQTFSVGLRSSTEVWFFEHDGGAIVNPGGAVTNTGDVLTFCCTYPVA